MRTEILIVLDRSGSMESIRKDIIGGFNAFIDRERLRDPEDAFVTLVQFDTIGYDVVYQARPLASAPYLTHETYEPRSGTPLYDAIGWTVTEQGKRFERATVKPDKVILVIITDGLNNSSTVYTKKQARDLVEMHEREWQWSVYMLGCSWDAMKENENLGIGAQGLRVNSTPRGVANAFSVLNRAVGAGRAQGVTYNYTADDRASAEEE